MTGWYRRTIGNKILANLMMVAVLATGTMATLNIRRESEPEVRLGMISVLVSYPGADPEEVEEGITQKVAAAIDGLRGVKRYTTTSREGSSHVLVEVADGYPVNEVKDRVTNALDSIDSLPARAERPLVFEEMDEDSVSLVFVWGDLPERQLKELATQVRDELQALPEVSVAELFSTRDYEITVDVSQEALQRYGLTLDDVAHAIRRSSLNMPAGSLKLDTEEVRIRALGRKYTGPEFESIVVTAGATGDSITLGQIGHVHDSFEESERYSLFNGQPCAVIDIDRGPGEDLLKISAAIERYVVEKQKTLPAGAHLSRAFDNTDFVRNQISMLTSNGVQGLILILIVLGLFLEPRLALWVGMGIPISLAGSVVVMWAMGWTINQLSLIGMILVLGMLVDDSVVVGEAIFFYRRAGLAPIDACVQGIREVALPVFASVSTTMIAFTPMLFLGGIMGQFIRQLPIVVITALIVSLFECYILFPAHLQYPLRDNKRMNWLSRTQKRVADSLEWFVAHVYGPIIDRAVQYRYATLSAAVAFLLLSFGLVAGGIVPVTQWPAAEGDNIDATIEFPPGTPASVVQEAIVASQEALERVAARTKTKSGAPLIKAVYTSVPPGYPSGSIMVELLSTRDRGLKVRDIIVDWQDEIGAIPGAVTQTYRGATIGAGDGSDIGLVLQGKDFGELRSAASELKAKLASYAGLYQIEDDFRAGKSELQVRLRPAARHFGLTVDEVSRQLYAAYQGEEALTLLRGREEVKIRVRLPRTERQRLADFSQFQVRTPDGRQVRLSAVAEVVEAEGVTTITGINGVRGIAVRASADRERVNPTDVQREVIEHFLPGLMQRHPGVTWSLSLMQEDNQKVLARLQQYAFLAILAIFVMLCTTFRSYLQPMLILTIMPFGVSGAILGHLVRGIPISMLSLIGLVALCGVIVNDSIVLIERANAFLAEGRSFIESICAAGRRRFRAIFLTSTTTVLGLGPMIAEGDLSAQVVTPMGVSIGAGLLVGMLLTLLLMPALFTILNDARRAAHRILHGRWPSPEEVEPASQWAPKPNETPADSMPGLAGM